MCHGSKKSSKTIRFKTENPKHANVIPYKKPKHKQDYRNYEE